jgi:hypothetical protein
MAALVELMPFWLSYVVVSVSVVCRVACCVCGVWCVAAGVWCLCLVCQFTNTDYANPTLRILCCFCFGCGCWCWLWLWWGAGQAKWPVRLAGLSFALRVLGTDLLLTAYCQIASSEVAIGHMRHAHECAASSSSNLVSGLPQTAACGMMQRRALPTGGRGTTPAITKFVAPP